MSPVSDLTSEALSRLAKCPWHQGTQMDVAWPWSKLRHCPPSPWRTQLRRPVYPHPRPPSCTHFLVCLKTEQQNRKRKTLEVSRNLSRSNIKKSDIKEKVGKQARLCVSEISIVWYCLRHEEEEGQRIREPCPVRAQSAGGNASGKPPYPCSDLEDAPAAARSRHSGAEQPHWIPTSCQLLRKL